MSPMEIKPRNSWIRQPLTGQPTHVSTGVQGAQSAALGVADEMVAHRDSSTESGQLITAQDRLRNMRPTSASGLQSSTPIALTSDALFQRMHDIFRSQPGISVKKAMLLAFADAAGIERSKLPDGGRSLYDHWEYHDYPIIEAMGPRAVPQLIEWSGEGGGLAPGLDRLLRSMPLDAQSASAILKIASSTQDSRLVFDTFALVVDNPSLSPDERLRWVAGNFRLLNDELQFSSDGHLDETSFVASDHRRAVDFLKSITNSKHANLRVTAATLLDAASLSPSEIQPMADALLNDSNYSVRVAASRLFWQSSDTTPERQEAMLEWFSSQEAFVQAQKATRTESHLSPAIQEMLSVGRAETAGLILQKAPSNVDVSPCLSEAINQPLTTGITEDAIAFVARSDMSQAEKAAWFVKLQPSASERQNDAFSLSMEVGALLMGDGGALPSDLTRCVLEPSAPPRASADLIAAMQVAGTAARQDAIVQWAKAQGPGLIQPGVLVGMLKSGQLKDNQARDLLEVASPNSSSYGAVLLAFVQQGGDVRLAREKLMASFSSIMNANSHSGAIQAYNLFAVAPHLLMAPGLTSSEICESVRAFLSHPTLLHGNNHFQAVGPGMLRQAEMLRLKDGALVLPELVRALGDYRVSDAERQQVLTGLFDGWRNAGQTRPSQSTKLLLQAFVRAGVSPELVAQMASSIFRDEMSRGKFDGDFLAYILQPASGNAPKVSLSALRREAVDTIANASNVGRLPQVMTLSDAERALDSTTSTDDLRKKLVEILNEVSPMGPFMGSTKELTEIRNYVGAAWFLPSSLRRRFVEAAVKDLRETLALVPPDSMVASQDQYSQMLQKLDSYNAPFACLFSGPLTGVLTDEEAVLVERWFEATTVNGSLVGTARLVNEFREAREYWRQHVDEPAKMFVEPSDLEPSSSTRPQSEHEILQLLATRSSEGLLELTLWEGANLAFAVPMVQQIASRFADEMKYQQPTVGLLPDVLGDPRLPADAAVAAARTALGSGDVANFVDGCRPLFSAVLGRSDVNQRDKDDLTRAFLALCEKTPTKGIPQNGSLESSFRNFSPELTRGYLVQAAEDLKRERAALSERPVSSNFPEYSKKAELESLDLRIRMIAVSGLIVSFA